MSFLWNALLFSIIFRIFAIIMKEISELNDLSIAMKVTKVRTKQGDTCSSSSRPSPGKTGSGKVAGR